MQNISKADRHAITDLKSMFSLVFFPLVDLLRFCFALYFLSIPSTSQSVISNIR